MPLYLKLACYNIGAETCSCILTVLLDQIQLCSTVCVIHKILCYVKYIISLFLFEIRLISGFYFTESVLCIKRKRTKIFHEWLYGLEHIWHFKEGSGAYCNARSISMTFRYAPVVELVALSLYVGSFSMFRDQPYGYFYSVNISNEGKVIPLQARCGPEGGWSYSSTVP